MRKVKLAKNAGFCFGVQRAVEEAIRIQKEYMKKVYTLGPLIHNNDVVKFRGTSYICNRFKRYRYFKKRGCYSNKVPWSS